MSGGREILTWSVIIVLMSQFIIFFLHLNLTIDPLFLIDISSSFLLLHELWNPPTERSDMDLLLSTLEMHALKRIRNRNHVEGGRQMSLIWHVVSRLQ